MPKYWASASFESGERIGGWRRLLSRRRALELSGTGAEAPSGAVRLLLQVRDVHDVSRRLVAAGVAIESEPEIKPWGLVEMIVRDPDGLAVVIVEVPVDHPQRRAG